MPRPFRERKRILCISRLIAEKKIDLLIRGFQKAAAFLPASVRLTLIGDGPERETLQKLANSHSSGSRIEFIGSVYDQSQLAPYFNDSILSVSPGYIGLSAIHSMAYGIPMLVADKEPHSPEIAIVESGINAEYFHANNADDLAQKLISFVEERQTAERMGQAARCSVQKQFSVDAMAEAFEQAIAYAHR